GSCEKLNLAPAWARVMKSPAVAETTRIILGSNCTVNAMRLTSFSVSALTTAAKRSPTLIAGGAAIFRKTGCGRPVSDASRVAKAIVAGDGSADAVARGGPSSAPTRGAGETGPVREEV